MGFNPGYSFDWYRRGPYSPSLTRMLFSANEQNQLRLERFSLTDPEKEVVSKLKEFLGDGVDNPRMLELLASVWYFMPRRSISNKEKNDLIEKIERFKPKYSRKEIIKAIERVKRFG